MAQFTHQDGVSLREHFECRILALEKALEKMEQSIRELELSRAELHGKASQASLVNVQIMALLGLLMGAVGVVLRFL